jgi:hypothetical protein
LVGGYAAQYKDWRWTQWSILFIMVAAYIVAVPMSETYKKIILQQRAKRLGLPPPPRQGPTGVAALKLIFTVTLVRPVHMLFTEPIVTFTSIYSAFNFAVLFTFFAAFPLIFRKAYGFDASETGLTFLAIGIGVLISAATLIIIDRIVYMGLHRRIVRAGGTTVPPEHRLYTAMLASFGLPIGLFWFAWTARPEIHWIVPVIAAVPFAWGNWGVFVSNRCAFS